MESHKVLIIGSGGRENALAWKISQSKFCDKFRFGLHRCGFTARLVLLISY